ncbi:MAG: glycosyltransferase [Pseudomonadota bacterium]
MVVDSWDQPFNGTVVSSRRFATALLNRGHSVRVLCLAGATHPIEGVEYYRLPPLLIPGVTSIMERMRTFLARPEGRVIETALTGADLLHIQFPFFAGGAAASIAQAMGVPVVASFHLQAENILRNLYLPNRLFSPIVYWLFRNYIYRKCKLVIAPSPFAARLIGSLAVDVPVRVLSNGIPSTQLDAYRHREFMPEQVKVLCVGRLAREKRYDIIVNALAKTKKPERYTVTFAGTGPKKASIEKLCEQRRVSAKFLTPSDEQLASLYREADLFLHAGESELEGMSVMQAMAAGVPTLVSDSNMSAARELTTIKSSRFHFPDSRDLAARIDALAERPELVSELSRGNHQAVACLDHHNVVNELLEIYRQAIGSDKLSKLETFTATG